MDTFRLSVAVMHHPTRAAVLPALLKSCAPLVPAVISDPDPDGPPSPLRTAKLAWAAVGDDATHHLVLQDDVTLVDGFADHLQHAVANGPNAGIALYVSWNSPHHAYEARRAAASGSAWARLDREWVPTLGLVLPAADARSLASYLSAFPDEHRHDDVLVADYCRERSLPIVAVVPQLIDHVESKSLAGNQTHGERHSTIFRKEQRIGSDYWSERAWPVEESHGPATAAYAVELYNSECRIRFFRTEAGEPWEHPFGWYWFDWCSLLGVEADRLLGRLDSYLHSAGRSVGGSPAPVIVETWAAGYLLGVDAAASRRDGWSVSADAGQLRTAVASWIDYGLTRSDRALLGPTDVESLIDLGVAAVAEGRMSHV